MTLFIQDLQTYLNGQSLPIDFIEFYDATTTDALTCLMIYDSSPSLGRYSMQFLRRDTSPLNCLTSLFAIYTHFFGAYQPKEVVKTINNLKYIFKPISKPTYLKKDNGVFYYTFNIEVIGETN